MHCGVHAIGHSALRIVDHRGPRQAGHSDTRQESAAVATQWRRTHAGISTWTASRHGHRRRKNKQARCSELSEVHCTERSFQELPGRHLLERTEARRRLASTRLVGLLSTVELTSSNVDRFQDWLVDASVSLKYETYASR